MTSHKDDQMTFQDAARKALSFMVSDWENDWKSAQFDELLEAATWRTSRGQTLTEWTWVTLGAIGLQAACQLSEDANADMIADGVLRLLVDKRHDYGADNLAAWGEFGVAVRMLDKVHRLRHLLRSGSPRNESLLDSAHDIVGYAVCGWMLRMGLWECEIAVEPTTTVFAPPRPEQMVLPLTSP